MMDFGSLLRGFCSIWATHQYYSGTTYSQAKIYCRVKGFMGYL
ncbi:hypothetical protein SOVF_167080 [Spinacia oleracea]|nr:hypothetical protein SOVF_167080 [Spinacia oleracea]